NSALKRVGTSCLAWSPFSPSDWAAQMRSASDICMAASGSCKAYSDRRHEGFAAPRGVKRHMAAACGAFTKLFYCRTSGRQSRQMEPGEAGVPGDGARLASLLGGDILLLGHVGLHLLQLPQAQLQERAPDRLALRLVELTQVGVGHQLGAGKGQQQHDDGVA